MANSSLVFSSRLNLKREDYTKEDWIKICNIFGCVNSCNEINLPKDK